MTRGELERWRHPPPRCHPRLDPGSRVARVHRPPLPPRHPRARPEDPQVGVAPGAGATMNPRRGGVSVRLEAALSAESSLGMTRRGGDGPAWPVGAVAKARPSTPKPTASPPKPAPPRNLRTKRKRGLAPADAKHDGTNGLGPALTGTGTPFAAPIPVRSAMTPSTNGPSSRRRRTPCNPWRRATPLPSAGRPARNGS